MTPVETEFGEMIRPTWPLGETDFPLVLSCVEDECRHGSLPGDTVIRCDCWGRHAGS